jgi:hypothetical protein
MLGLYANSLTIMKMRPIPSVPGGVYCSITSGGTNIFSLVNLLIGFGLEVTLLIMFVYRINKVDHMSEDAEPSTTTSKTNSKTGTQTSTSTSEHKKGGMSSFKLLAIKFASLTWVMTVTSFLVVVMSALFRPIASIQLSLDALVSGLCIYLTFHDEVGEKVYRFLCCPCDRLCLCCHPCTEKCFDTCVEDATVAAEIIAKMTSLSSKTRPDYADELAKENTGRSVVSTGSDGSAGQTASI